MRQRGTTLLEVLVAITLLTLVFLLVSQDMIATSAAQSDAASSTVAVGEGNYLLSQMQNDSNFWSEVNPAPSMTPGSGFNDCGTPVPSYNDSYTKPAPGATDGNAWHVPGNEIQCHGSTNSLAYMWSASIRGSDTHAADITVWVNSGEGVYEVHGMKKDDPQPLVAASPPLLPTPKPTITPTPAPSAPTTPTPPPTPKPSPTATAKPTPKPSATPKPSPTPTAKPTPTPQPTIGQ
ncbi:MAG TPA: prepilin-type N-terminal cleavage/methylation domain-containing protein [Candidatus Eremiobacteraceae bacterium]